MAEFKDAGWFAAFDGPLGPRENKEKEVNTTVQKAGGLPVGTRRKHSDGYEYEKQSSGKWARVIDSKQDKPTEAPEEDKKPLPEEEDQEIMGTDEGTNDEEDLINEYADTLMNATDEELSKLDDILSREFEDFKATLPEEAENMGFDDYKATFIDLVRNDPESFNLDELEEMVNALGSDGGSSEDISSEDVSDEDPDLVADFDDLLDQTEDDDDLVYEIKDAISSMSDDEIVMLGTKFDLYPKDFGNLEDMVEELTSKIIEKPNMVEELLNIDESEDDD